MPMSPSRRILFHYPVLNLGGAEKSSLRLMSALADRGWEITLVLTTAGGSLESAVDRRIKVVSLRPNASGARFAASRGLRRLHELPDLLAYLAGRALGAVRMIPFLFTSFEAAGVLLHSTSPFFVANVVRARARLHWIRNDLKGVDPDGRIAARLKRYEKAIGYFVCVSDTARTSLIEAVPTSRDKAVVVYNVLNTADMRSSLAKATDPFPRRSPGKIKIVTVCRLSDRDKAIFRMARVCKALVKRELDFVWYVVGDGPDRVRLQSLIGELGISDRMILCGAMADPFPAYKYADLVAVLSYHEGLCGVINEAKVSGCAVIATRVSGVMEQLTHGVNGWIVENSESAIIDGMYELLSSSDRMSSIRNDLYPRAITDDDEKIRMLERLMSPDRTLENDA